jgi:hypothetical protein
MIPQSFNANDYKILVEKSKARRLFGSPRCSRDDNIKTDPKGTELGGTD